jgi:hypothetical protein
VPIVLDVYAFAFKILDHAKDNVVGIMFTHKRSVPPFLSAIRVTIE